MIRALAVPVPLIVVAAALSLILNAPAAEQRQPSPPPAVAGPTTAPDDALLNQKLAVVSFSATPLAEAIDFFRQRAGVGIFVDWKDLQDAGIDRSSPITANLRDIALRKALSIILAEAGRNKTKLGFVLENGILTIATEQAISRNSAITRVYDVRRVLSTLSLPQDHPPTTNPSRQQQVDGLITLIEETVAPDTWRATGGGVGSIQELSGQLIVTHTLDAHRQVRALLEQIRAASPTQIIVEVRFLTVDTCNWPETLKAKLAPALNCSEPWSLDASEAEAIVKQSVNHAETWLVAAPRMVAFSGELARIDTLSETSYHADYVVVKTAAGDWRFEPQRATVAAGLRLAVTPTASADHKSVTMAMTARLSQLAELQNEKWPGAAGVDLQIQKPVLTSYDVTTTASVPDGRVLVLAATPAQSSSATTHPGSQRRLFVFAKPTIVMPREVPTTENSDAKIQPPRGGAIPPP